MYDYDGNRHTMILSPRVSALSSVACSHFDALEGEGDPFWNAGDAITPTMQAGVKILHPDSSTTSSI